MKWNHITWFSKLIAAGLFVTALGLSFLFGAAFEQTTHYDVPLVNFYVDHGGSLVTKTPNSPASLTCTPDQRPGTLCSQIYQPVCGTINIQCVKAPCNPVTQTFANGCTACHNPLVNSYTAGTCSPSKAEPE